ncbi:MAG: hypothetical protein JSS30_08145 [Verrucomicrobia bacterium]|nr:hypothetical protein [Verrucomicrobiota bacterium]
MSFINGLKELGFEGKPPLSAREREMVYAAAYGMYEVGDYEKSANLFELLVLNDPHELRFWQGLASSRQMNRQYQSALHAWSIVCLLGGHQPQSHFHAAECYLSIGDLEQAGKALNCAKFHLKKNSSDLSNKIEELRKVVSNG